MRPPPDFSCRPSAAARVAMRRVLAILLVPLAFGVPTAAAADGTWPGPDLAKLLRLVTPALEKPRVPPPMLALPPAPQPPPDLPHPRLVTDPANRPMARLGSPGALACNPLGTVLGVGSQLVDCGKARLARGELDGAREAFQDAVDRSGNRDVIRAARYWLAETLVRMGKRDVAEPHLSLVAGDARRDELGLYAAHLQGWLLLERGDAARALGVFEPLVRGSLPPDLAPYVQHGRALALYGLGRYPEARDQWTALLSRSQPRPLATEASFWLGDTLGRLGDPKEAVARLQVFTAGGPTYLIQPGLLSLAWWTRAAGPPIEAVKTYHGLLNAYPDTPDQLWARFGLAQALVDLGDLDAARAEMARVQTLDPQGAVTVAGLTTIALAAIEANRHAVGQAVLQDLLSRQLDAATRAYVLLLGGELYRQMGEPGEARSRLEGVRSSAGGAILGWHASIRLGQMELEARDFAAARAISDALLQEQLPADYQSATLVLAAESAYGLQQYERAAGLFTRLGAGGPDVPGAGEAVFSLGWTEMRRGRLAEAQQAWGRFATDLASHPLAATALLLGAEAAARAGDPRAAAALLDRVIGGFSDQEPARIALLDRAVLALRAGRAPDALRDLRGLESESSMSPYLGPVRAARGAALTAMGQPAEAEAEFRAAMAAGEDDMGHLGLGRIAYDRRQWDEAAREFAAARDGGAGPVSAAAEYGLAATAFARGDSAEFRRLAGPLLAGARDPVTAPYLLAGLVATSAHDKQWREAKVHATELVATYPDHRITPPALADVGRAATADGQWIAATETFQVLADRYPTSPAFDEVQLEFAEALLRTGSTSEASRRLETLVGHRPGDARAPRALLLLAEAQEGAGDRAAALETYSRLRRDHPGVPGADTAGLGQARLLVADGRWDEARPLLEETLTAAQGDAAAEAAFHLGEGLRAAGQLQDAVEAYMTAAYVAPDSVWARRALLGAGQSYAGLKQGPSAAIVYRKLLAATDVEPDLADQARQGLTEIGAN